MERKRKDKFTSDSEGRKGDETFFKKIQNMYIYIYFFPIFLKSVFTVWLCFLISRTVTSPEVSFASIN